MNRKTAKSKPRGTTTPTRAEIEHALIDYARGRTSIIPKHVLDAAATDPDLADKVQRLRRLRSGRRLGIAGIAELLALVVQMLIKLFGK